MVRSALTIQSMKCGQKCSYNTKYEVWPEVFLQCKVWGRGLETESANRSQTTHSLHMVTIGPSWKLYVRTSRPPCAQCAWSHIPSCTTAGPAWKEWRGRRPGYCAHCTWSDTPALPPHLLNWTNPLVCVTSRPDSISKIPFKSQNWIAIKPPVSGSTSMGNIIIATGREKIYLSAFLMIFVTSS